MQYLIVFSYTWCWVGKVTSKLTDTDTQGFKERTSQVVICVAKSYRVRCIHYETTKFHDQKIQEAEPTDTIKQNTPSC